MSGYFRWCYCCCFIQYFTWQRKIRVVYYSIRLWNAPFIIQLTKELTSKKYIYTYINKQNCISLAIVPGTHFYGKCTWNFLFFLGPDSLLPVSLPSYAVRMNIRIAICFYHGFCNNSENPFFVSEVTELTYWHIEYRRFNNLVSLFLVNSILN